MPDNLLPYDVNQWAQQKQLQSEEVKRRHEEAGVLGAAGGMVKEAVHAGTSTALGMFGADEAAQRERDIIARSQEERGAQAAGFGEQALASAIQSAPAVAMSLAVGRKAGAPFGPAGQRLAVGGAMGATVMPDAYNEAIAKGLTPDEATRYAQAVALNEAFFSTLMPGGVESIGRQSAKRGLKPLLGRGLGEGAEEGLTETMNINLANEMGVQDANIFDDESLRQQGIAALSGPIMSYAMDPRQTLSDLSGIADPIRQRIALNREAEQLNALMNQPEADQYGVSLVPEAPPAIAGLPDMAAPSIDQQIAGMFDQALADPSIQSPLVDQYIADQMNVEQPPIVTDVADIGFEDIAAQSELEQIMADMARQYEQDMLADYVQNDPRRQELLDRLKDRAITTPNDFNRGEYDGYRDLLNQYGPRASRFMSQKGGTPIDALAQELADSGLIQSADPEAVWQAIGDILAQETQVRKDQAQPVVVEPVSQPPQQAEAAPISEQPLAEAPEAIAEAQAPEDTAGEFATGDMVTATRGKKKGQQYEVDAVKPDGRLVLKDQAGKILGDKHGLDPNNYSRNQPAVTATQPQPQQQPQPQPQPVVEPEAEPAAPQAQPKAEPVSAQSSAADQGEAVLPEAAPSESKQESEQQAAGDVESKQSTQNNDRPIIPRGIIIDWDVEQPDADEARIKGGRFHVVMTRQSPFKSVDGYGETRIDAINNGLRKLGDIPQSQEPLPQAEAAPLDQGAVAPQQEAAPVTDNPLRDRFAQSFREGRSFSTIAQARKFAQEITGEKVVSGTPAAKRLDEAIEEAVVLRSREIEQEGLSSAETYRKMVELYEQQPKLAVRSATSVKNQAYSTPAPLSYLARHIAGFSDAQTAFEPTAGNGLLAASGNRPGVTLNELNDDRVDALRRLFPDATIKVMDATNKIVADQSQDAIIMNPPFGALRDDAGAAQVWNIEGHETNQIDHAIVLQSLKGLKPDGKAVLIIGGVNKLTKGKAKQNAYRSKQKGDFFKKIYGNYNVTDHFTVAGELYAKQGAGWPVDVIVISGRGKSSMPHPAGNIPRLYQSWDELATLAESEYDHGAVRAARDDDLRTPGQDAGIPESAGGGEVRPDNGQPARGDGADGVRGPRTKVDRPAAADEQPRVVSEDVVADEPDRVRPVSRPDGERDGRERPDRELGTREDRAPAERVAKPRRERKELSQEQRELAGENAGQVAYQPESGQESLNTLVPTAMRDAVQRSLQNIATQRGDIDSYVADQLGMTEAELGDALSAEQIDAVALAIDNMDKGSAMILGDQTGIGKGRVVAAVLRYAIKEGKKPVFITEKAGLYKDMYRDLMDIRVEKMLGRKLKILHTNTERIELDENGPVLQGSTAKAKNEQLASLTEKGLGDYDIIFSTYSQMQTNGDKPVPRRDFIRSITPDNILVFDESHNAGGQGKGNDAKRENGQPSRSEFVRNLASEAGGVMFSSATYAKNPKVMDLYARTDMRFAVANVEDLAESIGKGGIPMQQILASMLAESGQYIRRERSFNGINYDVKAVDVDTKAYDDFSEAIRNIHIFSSQFMGEAAEELDNELAQSGDRLGADNATGEKGADTVNFTSIMHNVIGQMLLAVKAKPAAEQAIQLWKEGKKPVLTVANTMESMIKNVVEAGDLKAGDPIESDFRDVLTRYLHRSREVIEKVGKDVKRRYLTDAEIGPEAARFFNKTLKLISSMESLADIPISPIDYMINEMKKAGMQIGEITGRTLTIDYSGSVPVLAQRSDKVKTTNGKNKTISGFNKGTLDAMILNQSGSTGLSLHASEKFADQKPRHMIIVQAEGNIDTHMQMLGRVNRTGQVVKPAYSQMYANVPAERRPAAVLAGKMASLNANTTGARDSAVSASDASIDIINAYGDRAAVAFVMAHPEINEELGAPVKDNERGGYVIEDAARKLTGRIPLLPLEEQEMAYREIIDNYTSLVEFSKANGTYTLEAQTLDLKAETISKQQVVAPNDEAGDSPFGEAVFVEKVKANRLGKPLEPEQAQAEAAKSLGLDTDTSWSKIDDSGRKTMREVMTSTREKFYDFRDITKSNLKDTTDSKLLDRIDAQFEKWREIRQSVWPGKVASLNLGNDESVDGIILSVTYQGSNKATVNPTNMSQWHVTIAPPNGLRKVKRPFSQIESVSYTSRSLDSMLDDMRKGGEETKEDRFIVTGNVLAGYDYTGQTGQVVRYTTIDGEIRSGIYMPGGWSYSEKSTQNAVKFRSVAQVMEFMNENSDATIKSADGDMVLVRTPRGFTLSIPGAKAKAGKWLFHAGLQAALGANHELTKSGNKYFAKAVPISELENVVKALHAISSLSPASHHEVAARIVGGESSGITEMRQTERGARPKKRQATKQRSDEVSPRVAMEHDATALTTDTRGALPLAPLHGGKQKRISEIIGTAVDILEASFGITKIPGVTLGFYNTRNGAIKVRRAGDIPTAFHELAHFADDQYGMIRHGQLTAFTEELMPFAQYGSQPEPGLSDRDAAEYVVREGYAEWFKSWMLNPEAARQAAPMMHQHFKESLPADLYRQLREVGDDARRFGTATPLEKMDSNTRTMFDRDLTLREKFQQWRRSLFGEKVAGWQINIFDKFTTANLDDMHPLVKAVKHVHRERYGNRKILPEHDPVTLLRLMGGLGDRFQSILKYGMIDSKLNVAKGVGGGLEWLYGTVRMDSQEAMMADLADINRVGLSERIIEQYDNALEDAAVWKEQQMDAAVMQYQDSLGALEKVAKRIIAQAEADARAVGKPIEKAGQTGEEIQRRAQLSDRDLAAVQDLLREAEAKGRDKRQIDGKASTARDRLARNSDRTSKEIIDLIESIDQSQKRVRLSAQKRVAALYDQLNRRYERQLAAINRRHQQKRVQAKRWADNIAGVGGGLSGDVDVARAALQQIQQDPSRYLRAKEGLKRYRAWADASLRYMRDLGRISPEHYDNITKRNNHYFAMNRYMEDGIDGLIKVGAGKLGRSKNRVQSFKGSTRELDDPYTNLIRNTMQMVEETDRNNALAQFVKSLNVNRAIGQGPVLNLSVIGQEAEEGRIIKFSNKQGAKEYQPIKVFINGEPTYWVFDEHVHKAITRLSDMPNHNWYGKVFMGMASMLRMGITYSPAFAVRNLMRDIQSWLILSPSAQKGDALTGKIEVRKEDLERAGGAFASYYAPSKDRWNKTLRKHLNQHRNDRNIIFGTLADAAGGYVNLLSKTEGVSRMREYSKRYKEAKSQGMDDYNAKLVAAAAARELIDFAVAGSAMRAVSPYLVFVNAGLQGLRATYIKAKQDPAGFAMRSLFYSVMPSLAALAFAAEGGDDELEEYMNLPSWRRDFFLNFKLGPNSWLAIPKPFELGMAGSAADRIAEGIMAGDWDKASYKFGRSLLDATVPHWQDLMPGKAVLEVLFNKDTFRDEDIIPFWEQDDPVYDKDGNLQRTGTKYASRIGFAIQEATGVDARQVDHLIRGTFGSLGGLGMRLTDLGRDDYNNLDSLFDNLAGVTRRGEVKQQVTVQRFIDQEQESGRSKGKATKRIAELAKQAYEAQTAEQRDALAKVLRDYAKGDNPLAVLDQMVSVTNRLDKIIKAARNNGAPVGHDAMIVTMQMKQLNGVQKAINQMIKQGASVEEINDQLSKDLDVDELKKLLRQGELTRPESE